MPYQVETSTVPFLIVTISYLVVLGLIGWWGNRQNRNLQDFFTMSGSAGAVLSGLAYFSTQYSMSTFMGVPGSIYHVGYAGMSVSVPGIAFSMVIPALLCRPQAHQARPPLQDAHDGRPILPTVMSRPPSGACSPS